MTYTIMLVDFYGDVPDSVRSEAVRRYRTALEKKLGGPENVPYHYRAFTNASGLEANLLNKSEAEAAAAWMVAHHMAVQEGFRGLGHSDEAYFEVRLT